MLWVLSQVLHVMISPTVRGNLWCPYSMPIEIDLKLATIATCVMLMFHRTKMECHSPWHNAWAFLWKSWVAQATRSPSWPFWCYPEESRAIRLAAEVAGKIAKLQSDRFRGSTPVFSGCSWPVKRYSFSHRRGQSVALVLHANWDILIIRNYWHPRYFDVS